MTETRIISFILRFMQPDGDAGAWRGVVRHVQSQEEARFTEPQEMLRFLNRFLSLGEQEAISRPTYSRFLERGGVRLHYLDYGGEGPPLLLLPGLTANAHMFTPLATALGVERRVLALDWRGRGRSDKPERDYRLADHAADVIALLDHAGWETATIAGHSFGGLVALYAAAHHPERIRRVVLLDSSEQLVNERTRALVQSTLDRLGEPFPSLDSYLQIVRRAPHLAAAWDDGLEYYYRSDVDVDAQGQARALAMPEAIAQAIAHQFEVPWHEVVAAVQQPVLLVNALAPFGDGDAPPVLPREVALTTVIRLADCAYLETPGNHITMLFGKNATQLATAIADFTEGER